MKQARSAPQTIALHFSAAAAADTRLAKNSIGLEEDSDPIEIPWWR